MTIEVTVVRDHAELAALEGPWRELAIADGGSHLRGPDWLMPWWHAYHRSLVAEPYVLLAHEDGELVGLAPLYRRVVKIPLVDLAELRLFGDAGPRPPALDILARPGTEDRVGTAFAHTLIERAEDWDLIALEPLADPSRVRANLVSRIADAKFAVDSAASGGGATRIALGMAPPEATDAGGVIVTYRDDLPQLRMGLATLRRLSRLEWSERDESSPIADPEASQLLEEATLSLGRDHRARLSIVNDAAGEAVACALVVDDGDRAVVLAMAVDPHATTRNAPQRLLYAEAIAARARGKIALDVVGGAVEYPMPPLPHSQRPALALRIWGSSRGAAIGRTYSSVAKRARRAREAPVAAAAQARAAWAKIRSTANSVAAFDKMCLVKGQVWTRGVAVPPGLAITTFTAEDHAALSEHARADLIEQLVLDEPTIQRWWARGDVAVLATLAGRPAGIVWTARGSIDVPELGRILQLGKYDAYIHSVFVAATARGRAVAPAMLEHVAGQLRASDAYRSWALIAADNQASLRAFQKASFTPVCDVVHTRVATMDRLSCRPPDPEALDLLGLA